MNIYLGGANASGKSTILGEVSRLAPHIRIVHGSALLMDSLGIPGDYEALRALPQTELRPAYGAAVTDLIATHSSHPRIFDSHYLNLRRGEVDHVTGDWIGAFDGFVLIYADPETTWQRIEHDHSSRDRGLFPENCPEDERRMMLEVYIESTRAEFERLLALHHKTGLVIDNTKQTANESARRLVHFIEQL